jgi:hypothetical protein
MYKCARSAVGIAPYKIDYTEALFCEIAVGADSISAQKKMNHYGEMIERIWKGAVEGYANVLSKYFIITLNHFYCILAL